MDFCEVVAVFLGRSDLALEMKERNFVLGYRETTGNPGTRELRRCAASARLRSPLELCLGPWR